MKKFKIPVTWEVYGTIEIEADSLEEAIQKFDDIEINEKADDIIEKNERIIVSKRDSEIFFNALMNPKEPNQNLKDAYEVAIREYYMQ